MSSLEFRPKKWKEEFNIDRKWTPDVVLLNEKLKELYPNDYKGIESSSNSVYRIYFSDGFDASPVLSWFKTLKEADFGDDIETPRKDPEKLAVFIEKKKLEIAEKDWTKITSEEKKLILGIWEPKDIDALAK